VTASANERRGWTAIIWSVANAELYSALRGSERLHWTQRAAREEAEAWCEEMGRGRVYWRVLDDNMALGRLDRCVVVVRSILLPIGSPPV
jgi:hypothetical protein